MTSLQLFAWVYWVLKNPLSEDQEDMAKSINNLFALLGTREAEIKKLKEKLARVGTTTCSHGTPTSERCEMLMMACLVLVAVGLWFIREERRMK